MQAEKLRNPGHISIAPLCESPAGMTNDREPSDICHYKDSSVPAKI